METLDTFKMWCYHRLHIAFKTVAGWFSDPAFLKRHHLTFAKLKTALAAHDQNSALMNLRERLLAFKHNLDVLAQQAPAPAAAEPAPLVIIEDKKPNTTLDFYEKRLVKLLILVFET